MRGRGENVEGESCSPVRGFRDSNIYIYIYIYIYKICITKINIHLEVRTCIQNPFLSSPLFQVGKATKPNKIGQVGLDFLPSLFSSHVLSCYFIVNLNTFSNPFLIFSNVLKVCRQAFSKKETSQLIGVEGQVPECFWLPLFVGVFLK